MVPGREDIQLAHEQATKDRRSEIERLKQEMHKQSIAVQARKKNIMLVAAFFIVISLSFSVLAFYGINHWFSQAPEEPVENANLPSSQEEQYPGYPEDMDDSTGNFDNEVPYDNEVDDEIDNEVPYDDETSYVEVGLDQDVYDEVKYSETGDSEDFEKHDTTEIEIDETNGNNYTEVDEYYYYEIPLSK